MTNVELLALTVLRTPHDQNAVNALLDLLLEDRRVGDEELAARPLLPTHRIPADVARLRAVVYCKREEYLDREQLQQVQSTVREWLAGDDGRHPVMVVTGIERIELYELPEDAAVSSEKAALRQLADKVRKLKRRRLPKP